jgi:hypothetical protein
MPKGVTQEQCAGMIDHPLLNWQAPTAYNPVHAAMSNGPETNSGECLLKKQAQHLKSNARPSQITLHIMSHQTCASRPSQHLQLRYCSNRAT